MNSEEQVEFLKEYDEWKSEKSLGLELSPDAFIIDRAKTRALEKLIKIDELMNAFYETDWETPEDYEMASTRLHDLITEVLED